MKPTALNKDDFKILDSIRGIASLYVVISHCRGNLWMGGRAFLEMFPRDSWGGLEYFMFGVSMLTRVAGEMVIVFFVLSGFSIAHSLAADKSPGPFYLRRLIRIYPTYLLGIFWAGVIFLLTRYWFPQWYDGSLKDQYSLIVPYATRDFFDWQVILSNLFYMPRGGFLGPYWSLTYEVIFYLLAPFLLRRINVYVLVSFSLFIVYNIIPSIIDTLGIPVYISLFLFKFNIYFATGVFVYSYFNSFQAFFSRVSRKIFFILVLLVGAAILGFNLYYTVETIYSMVAAGIFGSVLILYFLKYKVKINWLMQVGKYSYTLYVSHFATCFLYLAIYWLIFSPDVPYIKNYLVWIPAVFVCLLIAYWQYLLVESKTKAMLEVLRGKKTAESGKSADVLVS